MMLPNFMSLSNLFGHHSTGSIYKNVTERSNVCHNKKYYLLSSIHTLLGSKLCPSTFLVFFLKSQKIIKIKIQTDWHDSTVKENGFNSQCLHTT